MRRSIQLLNRLRGKWDQDSVDRKLSLLDGEPSEFSGSGALLRAWHDQLLFLVAYPDTAAVARAATKELRRLGDYLAQMVDRSTGLRRALHGSGLAHTALCYSYSVDLLRGLAERFGSDVELDWDDPALAGALEELLQTLVRTAEADGLLSDSVSTREWLGLARRPARKRGLASRRGPRTDLSQLLHLISAHPRSDWLDQLCDAANISVRWRLGHRDASRTWTRFPRRPMHYQHRSPIDRREAVALVRRRLPSPVAMTARDRLQLIDVARSALAVRMRETDPVTYANPDEVTCFQLERGVDIALFGMRPSRRLPVESYLGFVAARNRVPIAYGGGWIFFGRCEIGVHLFEEYRGGESAVLFAQVMRVYHRYYRARQFLVDPYQFGAGNPDAIRSGAFWFYYHLGFRPTDPRLNALAAREAARRRADPRYRSSVSILKRLAGSKIYCDVVARGRRQDGGAAMPSEEAYVPTAPDLQALGLETTRWIGRHFDGDRRRAHEDATRRLRQILSIGDYSRWSATRRTWFERLAVVALLVPELRSWPRAEKNALGAALRAKGGPRERSYVLALQRCRRFQLALTTLLEDPGSRHG